MESSETDILWLGAQCWPLTCGVTERAAPKQSTALSYSPLRLNKTPRPHCSWGSTWEGSELAARKNRFWTSVNNDLCRKTRRKENKQKSHFCNMSAERLPGFITHSGNSDPNRSFSFSLSWPPSLWRSCSDCSHTDWYFGLCFSQSRNVSQACLCSDSLVKLTASAISAVRLSFFSSIHLLRKSSKTKGGKLH